MNRQAIGPHSMRGLPSGFPSAQQMPPNRSVSSRLPATGKMSASNTTGWAFAGGMGNGGLPNNRQNNGPMASFAQAMGGSSQSSAQLDLSEFPSLSNHPTQQILTSSQSTWATAGARGLAPSANPRLQHSNLSSAQQLGVQAQSHPPEEMFNSSSQIATSQTGFRFSGQNPVSQSSQSQPNASEEFPPLGRNGNGEVGMMQNSAFGGSSNGLGFGANSAPQQNRSNGLLNALSGNSRLVAGNRVASPASVSSVSNSRAPNDPNRQNFGGMTENDPGSFSSSHLTTKREENRAQQNLAPGSSRPDAAPQQGDQAVSRSQTLDSGLGSSQGNEEADPEVQDPLNGMNDLDKYGLKGLSFMMNNYPDYAALIAGAEIPALGLDFDAREPFATQIYSLFDNEPPRPTIPQFTNPECYRVHNVATVETKLSNFNDESLLFMFYSNPNDVQQVLAAQELNNRNWRYHKKLQLWLTKDAEMQPHVLSNDTERGYYIFFDTKMWQRERREFTLKYCDLDSLPTAA